VHIAAVLFGDECGGGFDGEETERECARGELNLIAVADDYARAQGIAVECEIERGVEVGDVIVTVSAFEFEEEVACGGHGVVREPEIALLACADTYAFVRQEFGVPLAPDFKMDY
jgi:hypothetical protein